jgi:hypothetical protein
LTLLHPVFAEFIDDAKTMGPKHIDYETASDIRDTICQFLTEKEIRAKIGEHLSRYFGLKVSSGHVGASEASTDGHITVGNHPIFILELKRELGSTHLEPTLQALAYFGLFCDQYQLWDDITSCHPCFIVHMAGQSLNYLDDSLFTSTKSNRTSALHWGLRIDDISSAGSIVSAPNGLPFDQRRSA